MKIVFGFISIFFLIAAILSGYMLFERIRLPYNEQGVYFDNVNETVINQQSVLAYGLIFITMACASIITICLYIRRNKPPSL